MKMNEFDIIKTFFEKQSLARKDVILGIGDDAAIVTVPPDQQLVITTDTLISDVHFLKDSHAYDIAYKSLAVNLSDLAAMGATPAWITLALTLPCIDEQWLTDFSKGLFALADRYHTQLIGGDMTRGPLAITIQANGFVPKNSALRRDGATAGDLIYVSNSIGDAGLGLKLLQNQIKLPLADQAILLEKINRPEPQILLGESLRGVANAAIDISDGLVQDLQHILDKSKVGATLFVDSIPLSTILRETLGSLAAIQLALTAGDDYQLCFTVAEKNIHLLPKNNFSFTCIGKIIAARELNLQFKNGEKYVFEMDGYKHF